MLLDDDGVRLDEPSPAERNRNPPSRSPRTCKRIVVRSWRRRSPNSSCKDSSRLLDGAIDPKAVQGQQDALFATRDAVAARVRA
jgi:hypothetical protein